MLTAKDFSPESRRQRKETSRGLHNAECFGNALRCIEGELERALNREISYISVQLTSAAPNFDGKKFSGKSVRDWQDKINEDLQQREFSVAWACETPDDEGLTLTVSW